MKTHHENTIQFSGYPLTIAHENPEALKTELTVVKSFPVNAPSSTADLPANNPQNWDVDWFNSYE